MNRMMLERRALQACVAIGGLVPFSAGMTGMLLGSGMLGDETGASLDSHVRYLSGLLCGLGLSFWFMIPTIERRAFTVRLLTCLVMLGGLARLLAALFVAVPSTSMLAAIAMELVITPALCLWQGRVARLSGNELGASQGG